MQPNARVGRPGPPAGRVLQAPDADPNQQAAVAQAAPEEAQALRDNIQRMQQRLRRIRRRAAARKQRLREKIRNPEKADDNEDEEEEEDGE